jgi:hypothetical protein
MNRKIIKAAIDAIILLRNAENVNTLNSPVPGQQKESVSVANAGKIVDVPINGGGPDLMLKPKPGLTNQQTNQEIFGKLFPVLYAAGNADPISKIASIVKQQAVGYDVNNFNSMTPEQKEKLAYSTANALNNYLNSFGTIWEYFNL